MAPPASSRAHSMSILHLYRYLLRETSYLPPAFSSTITSQIRHQFHQHKKYDSHVKKRTMRARSALSTIRAANHGDAKCMHSLISKGFGRIGKRRRELLSDFVTSQGPSDSAGLKALLQKSQSTTTPDADAAAEKDGKTADDAESQPTTPRPNHAFIDKWDRPKLTQFLQSQREVQNSSTGTMHWDSKIKSTKEQSTVPKVNTWGKPPSETLTRAKLAKFWKRQADKMIPPVGKGEWDLLQRLTQGAQNEGEWSIPLRRTKAKVLHKDGEVDENTWNWEAYATHPTSWVEQPRTSRVRRNPEDSAVGPYTGKKLRDELPERWFRRTYQKVWQMTSYMDQDPNKLEYKFTWGTAKDSLVKPLKSQLGVFDGVDAQGRLPRKEKQKHHQHASKP